MTARWPIVIAVLAALLALPIALGARRLARAEQRVVATETALLRMEQDARRVRVLRAGEQRIAERRRPEQDVIARVNEALAAADIAGNRFGGVRPETDGPLPGVGGGTEYRRQVVRISLRRMTVEQLGSFLCEWDGAQEIWTPTRIELTHVRGPSAPPRYDAAVLMTAVYLAD